MALLRTRLLAGSLFAGALFGAVLSVSQPEAIRGDIAYVLSPKLALYAETAQPVSAVFSRTDVLAIGTLHDCSVADTKTSRITVDRKRSNKSFQEENKDAPQEKSQESRIRLAHHVLTSIQCAYVHGALDAIDVLTTDDRESRFATNDALTVRHTKGV